MKTITYTVRTLLVFMLILYCVGVYAQRKEVSYFNDSVDICPLADKELIDSCYNLLDRNMMLETDGIYGQIAVIDATTSEVLAWASLENSWMMSVKGAVTWYMYHSKRISGLSVAQLIVAQMSVAPLAATQQRRTMP